LYNEDAIQYVNITTQPFWERNNRQRLVLIMFEESKEAQPDDTHAEEFNISESASQRIENLEQELQYTKENLQATIEELETSNEELQATNEELLAANEELQSTNEELQSVNEELTTVNTEYQLKIRELTNLNNDINNLLSSTQIGTIFLDTSLHIRKFTPAAQADFNLLDQDIGRPFTHISHHLQEKIDLLTDVKQVLDTLTPVEKEVHSKGNRWVIIKMMPYITHTNLIDGVVITLVDITRRKQAEDSLADSENSFRAALKHTPIALYRQDRDLRYTWVYDPRPDFDPKNILGKTDAEIYPNGEFKNLIAAKQAVFETGQQSRQDVSIYSDGKDVYYDLKIDPMLDSSGEVQEIMCASVDITKAKLADKRAKMFESTISASSESIVIADLAQPDTPVIYANPAFEQLTGYSVEEVIGKNCRFMQRDDQDQPGLKAIKEAVATGGECQVTLRNYRKDGSMFLNQLTIYPVRTNSGPATYYVGIQRDVTDQTEAS
jgi:two-component system CheB/CheR fusion protein